MTAKAAIHRWITLAVPVCPPFALGETGNYDVDPDCTGFQTINLGDGTVIENAFVFSNSGRSFHGVVAEFTVAGTAVPIQSRVDGWKVASDQDD